jgi:hypothetical protein
MAYQVSIFLENKLGHLQQVTSVLREARINIRSMHLNHTASGWGILNLVVSDPDKASALLNEKGISTALRKIAALKMDDQPGGLDDLLRLIAQAGVNFTNAYGRVVNDNQTAIFVLDIEDLQDAPNRLQQAGLEILSDPVVYGIAKN